MCIGKKTDKSAVMTDNGFVEFTLLCSDYFFRLCIFSEIKMTHFKKIYKYLSIHSIILLFMIILIRSNDHFMWFGDQQGIDYIIPDVLISNRCV